MAKVVLKKEEKNQHQQKQEILCQVVDQAKLKVSHQVHKTITNFIELYYANVPFEDIEDTPIADLVESTLSMWNFGFTRKEKEIKIRIYTKQKEIKGVSTPQTIVEIINDNMPFLVDSVAGAINSKGYSINLIIHPVFQVVRDEKHNITNIHQRKIKTKTKTGNFESFIYCEILETTTPEKIKVLKKEIICSLNDVRLAVEDWRPMRKSLRDVIKQLQKTQLSISKEELKETISFLDWIENDHFTFLGYCTYDLVSGQDTIKKTLVPQNGLGILRDPERQKLTHVFEGVNLTPSSRRFILASGPVIITKTTQISLVHRHDAMDSITIKKMDKNGEVTGIYEFVGLFTSVAYHRSAREIPLLRRKIKRILKRSGFSEQWHDGKTLIHILETFPRDELFQASETWLFNTSMEILQLQNRQRLTLFIRPDQFDRFVSCIVYVPRERYDTELRK